MQWQQPNLLKMEYELKSDETLFWRPCASEAHGELLPRPKAPMAAGHSNELDFGRHSDDPSMQFGRRNSHFQE